jgi:hypothetical protein
LNKILFFFLGITFEAKLMLLETSVADFPPIIMLWGYTNNYGIDNIGEINLVVF